MKELQQDLFNLLESETSILAPLDAGPLAETLIDNLPPVYAAAPQLLEALESLDGPMFTGDSHSPYFTYNQDQREKIRAAINATKGE